jgi:hypothetical protein
VKKTAQNVAQAILCQAQRITLTVEKEAYRCGHFFKFEKKSAQIKESPLDTLL